MTDLSKLREIATRHLADVLDGRALHDDAHWFHHVGADNLDLLGIVCEVEDAFDVFIDDDGMERIASIATLAQEVEKARKEAA